MKLNEISSVHGDPLLYDILQQRRRKKERVVFWAWEGSEEINGELRWIERDDDEEPTCYLFHFKNLRSDARGLDMMGFIAADLESADLEKVGAEWHLSIPKPKEE